MPDEITLGPLTFQLERTGDGSRVTGMAIVNGEETVGWIESFTAEDWSVFEAAAMGATVVQAPTPTPKDPGDSPGDARAAAALGRMTQTMQMLGALSFQSFVLAMSIGRGLHDPRMHDTIRKDARDLEEQARELRKFITRLLYVRAAEER
jgi:hypothetical protein